MPTPTRIANKTQWALQDVLVALKAARGSVQAIQERNEGKLMDPVLAMYLFHLLESLAKIEITTVRAQHGEYGSPVDGPTTTHP